MQSRRRHDCFKLEWMPAQQCIHRSNKRQVPHALCAHKRIINGAISQSYETLYRTVLAKILCGQLHFSNVICFCGQSFPNEHSPMIVSIEKWSDKMCYSKIEAQPPSILTGSMLLYKKPIPSPQWRGAGNELWRHAVILSHGLPMTSRKWVGGFGFAQREIKLDVQR